MFYSQFILAKKGPLGTIWIAAHLERKLRKNQVADTDIGVSVDSILFPEVPIALRLSSHLLLGVVRIYNRKVNYLFDDCSEALLKIKQAFRSTAVDLPPEESKAPYHSITLPETFDLDDFELPDNDILQGNYVDHHISSRDQITLQDTMEGVSYSTSKFGLDERFGDGDASGLDLDEELFLDKIGSSKLMADHADESADPQATVGSIDTVSRDAQYKTVDLENKADDVGQFSDFMDYSHAPCTPGLAEEPNFSTVQEVSAGDDHLDSEYNLMESSVRENSKNVNYEDKQEVEWSSRDGTNSDAAHQVSMEENGCPSDGLETKITKTLGPVNNGILPSDLTDRTIETSDIRREDLNDQAVAKDNLYSFSVNGLGNDNQGPNTKSAETDACRNSLLISPCQDDSKDLSEEIQQRHGFEDSYKESNFLLLESDGKSHLESPVETQANQNPIYSSELTVHENMAFCDTPLLRACNINLEPHSNVQSNIAILTTAGRETIAITGQTLEGNHVKGQSSSNYADAALGKLNCQVCHSDSSEKPDGNLDNMEDCQMPTPEKLLAVPDGQVHQPKDMLEEVILKECDDGLAEGDSGSKTITGKKRSFTESTLTEQSLNSVESSRFVRAKGTAESIPDDDDLLSSILVGRSSFLKVKPTPPFSEVLSMKRIRFASRSGPPKRKVLMDDTMVLHGDSIRQQLTNTEDIRRVRKKAPCTIPEINMIQRQGLEEEIFFEALLTGFSVELASLHRQLTDLTQIRIYYDDANNVSLGNDVESNLDPLPQNIDNGVIFEIRPEPNLAYDNVQYGASLDVADEALLNSQNDETGINFDMENVRGFSFPSVDEQGTMDTSDDLWLVGNNEMAVPSENLLEEGYDSHEQIIKSANDMENMVSKHLVLKEACVEATEKNTDIVNDGAIAVIESITCTDYVDTGHMVNSVSNDPCVKSSFSNMDASTVSGEHRDDAPSIELDHEVKDFIDEQVAEIDEIKQKDHDIILNEGSSHFSLDDRDESNYLVSANDTEFLNVDDDELNDIADDYPLDGEEARFTENTGWSSRTRAVSKYLQMMFLKEEEYGRKSISMDNLLAGKSRKEASRMFFETLVLKTRDYIHTEQRNPLDDISIKPRARLMKSDF